MILFVHFLSRNNNLYKPAPPLDFSVAENSATAFITL